MAEILRKINVCPTDFNHKNRSVSGFFSDNKSTHVSFKPVILKSSSSSSYLSSCNFYGRRVVNCRPNGRKTVVGASSSQMRIGSKKVQGWWEKGHKTNMKEVEGPEDLVESLLNAGDKLVVVNFFSPGCGGCRALHPKICQLAEMNPDVEFLQVNYEEHKSMCYALNVHVLPFFRFYRGAHGRLCSFSCTNATIKKFKDALAKHSPDRCSLGPTKGLEEKELAALAANKDLSFTYKPKPEQPLNIPGKEISPAPAPASDMNLYPPLPLPRPLQPEKVPNLTKDSMNKKLAVSGR